MMTEEIDYLPIQALPNLVRLVGLYNRSLEELIQLLEVEGNKLSLTKQFDHLIYDFDFYEKTYQHWFAEFYKTEKEASLLALKALLDESKSLITKAIGLIQH